MTENTQVVRGVPRIRWNKFATGGEAEYVGTSEATKTAVQLRKVISKLAPDDDYPNLCGRTIRGYINWSLNGNPAKNIHIQHCLSEECVKKGEFSEKNQTETKTKRTL